ncbi:MAG: desulfoferrodoxin [Oscillospiraceae bacterium]|nr:desulfoferrodoxin [Oscillospiraceae bacterium]
MSSNHRFFKCDLCGNLTGLISKKGAPLVCCGQNMTELIPNTIEASAEKHVPSVSSSADKIDVQIGSVPHPMEDAHFIEFIYVETKNGGQRKCLKPGVDPKCSFVFTDDAPIAVYAYCNLHGLWELGL